jgi:hypothetical protein
MSQEIGPQLPPPLRFEFGAHPTGGEPKAVLLVTTDADGAPRVAVLGAPEMKAHDATHIHFVVATTSSTCQNLRRFGKAALWCVLDAAAYCIRGDVAPAQTPAKPDVREFCTFEMSVVSVLRDFRADAPMVSGPTYRRL